MAARNVQPYAELVTPHLVRPHRRPSYVSRIDLSSVVHLFLERPQDESAEQSLASGLVALFDALMAHAPANVRERVAEAPAGQLLLFEGERDDVWRVSADARSGAGWVEREAWRSSRIASLELLASFGVPEDAIGHVTWWRSTRGGSHTDSLPGHGGAAADVAAYSLRLVLVDALGAYDSPTGKRLRELLSPYSTLHWRQVARRVLASQSVPGLPRDDRVYEIRASEALRARRELAAIFAGMREAFAQRDQSTPAHEMAVAWSKAQPTWISPSRRREHYPRWYCPEQLRPLPPLGGDTLLGNILAQLILEGDYEKDSAAALPMELIASGGRALSTTGWAESTRNVRHRLRDLAVGLLDQELYGRGIESRRGTRAVLSLDAEDVTNRATSLGRDDSVVDPALKHVDRELDFDLFGAALSPRLGPAYQEALILAIEGVRTDSTLLAVCARRGVSYDLVRKRLERARRLTRESSSIMSQRQSQLSLP